MCVQRSSIGSTFWPVSVGSSVPSESMSTIIILSVLMIVTLAAGKYVVSSQQVTPVVVTSCPVNALLVTVVLDSVTLGIVVLDVLVTFVPISVEMVVLLIVT